MNARWSAMVTGSMVVVALWAGVLRAQDQSHGESYIGVFLRDITAGDATRYGLRGPAVMAASVVPDGPAYKAGLRASDAITSVDGHAVTDARSAADWLRPHRAGSTVHVGIVHIMADGRHVATELGIVAEPRPRNYGVPSQPGAPSPPGATPPAGASREPGVPPQASSPPPSVPIAPPATAAARPPGGLRLIDPQTARQGVPQRQGNCTALVPPGWTMTVGAYGDTADVAGANGNAHAAWGIRGVNTAMRAYYGEMYGPPEVGALATASMAIGAQAHYTSGATTVAGYFTAQSLAAGSTVGTVLHHAYPGPAPGQYVLSMFLAWVDAGAANLLPTAEAVMASISCQTRLHPGEMAPPPSRAGSRGASAESDKLKDYNVQLGTQWAHSSTGRHYLLDHATQWNDTGPDGPGYYIKSGNSYEKLTPGW